MLALEQQQQQQHRDARSSGRNRCTCFPLDIVVSIMEFIPWRLKVGFFDELHLPVATWYRMAQDESSRAQLEPGVQDSLGDLCAAAQAAENENGSTQAFRAELHRFTAVMDQAGRGARAHELRTAPTAILPSWWRPRHAHMYLLNGDLEGRDLAGFIRVENQRQQHLRQLSNTLPCSFWLPSVLEGAGVGAQLDDLPTTAMSGMAAKSPPSCSLSELLSAEDGALCPILANYVAFGGRGRGAVGLTDVADAISATAISAARVTARTKSQTRREGQDWPGATTPVPPPSALDCSRELRDERLREAIFVARLPGAFTESSRAYLLMQSDPGPASAMLARALEAELRFQALRDELFAHNIFDDVICRESLENYVERGTVPERIGNSMMDLIRLECACVYVREHGSAWLQAHTNFYRECEELEWGGGCDDTESGGPARPVDIVATADPPAQATAEAVAADTHSLSADESGHLTQFWSDPEESERAFADRNLLRWTLTKRTMQRFQRHLSAALEPLAPERMPLGDMRFAFQQERMSQHTGYLSVPLNRFKADALEQVMLARFTGPAPHVLAAYTVSDAHQIPSAPVSSHPVSAPANTQGPAFPSDPWALPR